MREKNLWEVTLLIARFKKETKMTTAIPSREQATFVELMNSKLDSIPIQNQADAQTAAAALGFLIGNNNPQSVPPPLQDRIEDLRELINDPLSIGTPSLYPPGHLRQYQQIAKERIPAKIRELLQHNSETIQREAARFRDQQIQKKHALENREHLWLLRKQKEFEREAIPPKEVIPPKNGFLDWFTFYDVFNSVGSGFPVFPL